MKRQFKSAMRYLKSHSIRLLLIINIVAVILLGYIVRFSHVFVESFHHIAGCVFYAILWVLVGAFLYPKATALSVFMRYTRPLLNQSFREILVLHIAGKRCNHRPIAIWVFLGTCGIEFLKLYQPPWFQAIRATLSGRLILGTTFDWYNFQIYLFGCYLGWLWIKFLDFQFQRSRQKIANNPDNLNR
jgi:Protein of unknown function (DUF2809)